MSEGKVIERGRHADLMLAGGRYAQLVNAGQSPSAQHEPTSIPDDDETIGVPMSPEVPRSATVAGRMWDDTSTLPLMRPVRAARADDQLFWTTPVSGMDSAGASSWTAPQQPEDESLIDPFDGDPLRDHEHSRLSRGLLIAALSIGLGALSIGAWGLEQRSSLPQAAPSMEVSPQPTPTKSATATPTTKASPILDPSPPRLRRPRRLRPSRWFHDRRQPRSDPRHQPCRAHQPSSTSPRRPPSPPPLVRRPRRRPRRHRRRLRPQLPPRRPPPPDRSRRRHLPKRRTPRDGVEARGELRSADQPPAPCPLLAGPG